MAITWGMFFRKKTSVSFYGETVNTGEKYKKTRIVPSSQFINAFMRLDKVKNLKVEDGTLFVLIDSNSDPNKIYIIAVRKSEGKLQIAHECSATQDDNPCWHEALAFILFDILVEQGKAVKLLTNNWTAEKAVRFLEQVYQDLKEYEIKVTGEEYVTFKERDSVSLTDRSLVILAPSSKSFPVTRLGAFLDPAGGAIIRETQYYIKKGVPFILIGDAGSGKTLLVQELAKWAKKKLFSTVITRNMIADDIIGMWTVGKNREMQYRPGVLALAMHEGGIAYFDELPKGSGSLLSKLYSVIDGRKEIYLGFSNSKGLPAVVKAKAGFAVAASGNLGFRYGNVVDDLALFDRFVPIKVPYLNEEQETALMVEKGFPKDVAKAAAKLAAKVRKLVEEKDLTPMSTRFVERVCMETEAVEDFHFAVERLSETLPKEEAELYRKVAMNISV